jgi:CelD/BcsL family acetyltransferase involved in cellulose biosynthesis
MMQARCRGGRVASIFAWPVERKKRAAVDKVWNESDAAAAGVRAAVTADCYELVTTPEAFLALREQWMQLCARVPGHYLGQTFDWAWLCWRTVAGPRGRGLACAVARSGGRLVLVWPLAIARDGGGGSIGRPLDSETSEYADVLVEDGPQAERRVKLALGMLRQARACDRLELANVRADSVLGRVLAALQPAVEGVRTGSLDAASVSWRGIESWDEYADGLEAKERRELGRKKRRLQEHGEVRFEVSSEPVRCAAIIDWSLGQKLAWLEQTGRRNGWIAAPEHREFLKASMASFGPSGRRVIFVLRLDGEIIAMLLCSVDDVRTEWFMCASHPGFARLSPAQILRERVLRWAWERRLDCDFRMGEQRFKAFWGNRVAHTSTYVIANSVRGRAFVVATRLRRSLAARLPPRARAALKAFAHNVFAPRA